MKLATLSIGGQPCAAVGLSNGTWLDIAKAGASFDSLQSIIDAGDEAVSALRAVVSQAEAGDHAEASSLIRP